MSDSDEPDVLTALQTIRKELNEAQERVSKLIRSQRRARVQAEEDVSEVLQKVRRKLSAVNEVLNEVELPVVVARVRNGAEAEKRSSGCVGL